MTTFDSPLQAFVHWEQTAPDKDFLRQYFNGKLEILTFRESGDQIRRIAKAITDKNLPPKSNVALLSKNCAHWIMADLAIMMSGHVSVPIYPTLHEESIKLILDHSDSKLLFVGKLDSYESQKNAFGNIPVISVEKYGISGSETWESLVERNPPMQNIKYNEPTDLISIIYTSGTTGNPKGVMHSIANFANAVKNLGEDLVPPNKQ